MSSGGGHDIKAGAAYVELFVKDEKLSRRANQGQIETEIVRQDIGQGRCRLHRHGCLRAGTASRVRQRLRRIRRVDSEDERTHGRRRGSPAKVGLCRQPVGNEPGRRGEGPQEPGQGRT